MTINRQPGTDLPDRFEIIHGEVVPLMPTGDVHGIVEVEIVVSLHALAAQGLGIALGGVEIHSYDNAMWTASAVAPS